MKGLMKTALPVVALLAASNASLPAQSTPGTARAEAGAFGRALAVRPDVVLVGEPQNLTRPGVVYVYRKGAGGWAEAAQLKASDAANSDGFGQAIAVDDAALVVTATAANEGAGAVYVFRRDGSTWREVARLTPQGGTATERFGTSVAIAGDHLLVGAPGAPTFGRGGGAGGQSAGIPGAVYIFRRTGPDQWTQQVRLSATDGGEGDLFGAAVALAGNVALVGAPGRNERAGVVYPLRLDRTSNGWQQGRAFAPRGIQRTELFGGAIALEGGRALIGAQGAAGGYGAAFVFRAPADTGDWSEENRLAAFDATRQDGFGSAVAMSATEAWIGAPRSANGRGAVHVIDQSAGAWTSARKLMTGDAELRGQFGGNLALSGNVGAITLASADYGMGRVAIFERNDANSPWREVTTVISPPDALPRVTEGEVKCNDGSASSFDCSEVDLLSFMPVTEIGGARGVRLNDIWGWTDPQSGKEYALVGRVDGTSFVDVSNPQKPVYLGDLPKTAGSPGASWRDIKVYKDHAFIVADASGQHGVQVFDLTRLRNVRNAPVQFAPDTTYHRIHSAHNIVINEATGFAFAVGASSGGETCGGGLHMINIQDPKKPTFAGCFADPQTGRASTGYSHDAQCVQYSGPDSEHAGKEICFGSNETALSIADVTDKNSPRALARAAYPNVGYSHQGWLTEDQRYFYMDDELDELNGAVARTRTLIWDVSDLDDPQLVGEFLGTTAASDHNLYVVGNTIYQSNYQAGLRVIDITDRTKPVEVGFFDTVPYGSNTPGFGGSWSNYPYFKSGIVVVTSGSEGLFVVKKRDRTVF